MTNNKLTTILMVATISLSSMIGYAATDHMQESKASVESNVGDGQPYVYEITDKDGMELHGIPLTKESDGNKGIFLYTTEVPFDVEVGDRIMVVWGEYEDEFAVIERAYKKDNGDWIGQSMYEIYK